MLKYVLTWMPLKVIFRIFQKASPVEKAEDFRFKDDIFNRPDSPPQQDPDTVQAYEQEVGQISGSTVVEYLSSTVF
jgi:hypothetical protein